MGIARFNSDGTLDAGFGNGGRVLADMGDGNIVVVRKMLLQPNGAIVIGGYAGPPFYNFALARYDQNGQLDAGFGVGGKVLLNEIGGRTDGRLYDMALQRDGRIVLAAGRVLARLN